MSWNPFKWFSSRTTKVKSWNKLKQNDTTNMFNKILEKCLLKRNIYNHYKIYSIPGRLGYIFPTKQLYERFIRFILSFCPNIIHFHQDIPERCCIAVNIYPIRHVNAKELDKFIGTFHNHTWHIDVIYQPKENDNMDISKRLCKDENKLSIAQSTIKNVKHDINKIHNQSKYSKKYIMLFDVDIWSRNGSNKYPMRYDVLSRSLNPNCPCIINNPDYYSVIHDSDCHFTKPFLQNQVDRYNDFIRYHFGQFETMIPLGTMIPRIMSLPEFKSIFDNN